jgi:hypothetical protein
VARNVEIKARVADPAALRARVAPLATAPAVVIGQRDTFFTVTRGRLKLRRFDDGTGELIFVLVQLAFVAWSVALLSVGLLSLRGAPPRS